MGWGVVVARGGVVCVVSGVVFVCCFVFFFVGGFGARVGALPAG